MGSGMNAFGHTGYIQVIPSRNQFFAVCTHCGDFGGDRNSRQEAEEDLKRHSEETGMSSLNRLDGRFPVRPF